MVENPRPPEAQDPEKLRSELKIALTRDKKEENAYVIKTRADQLELDRNAGLNQTRGMITIAELQQPGGTEIAGGHLNEAAQEWKELKADGKVPEKMNEKAIDICNKSFNYLKALQNDVKEKLIPSRASNAEAKEFRTDLRDNLNAILVKAMENGVIVYHEPSGKIRNSVGKAAAQLREVDELEQQILQSYGKVTREGKLPPELQIQLSLIDRTKDFFQMVIDGDPENKERHAALHPKEDMDPAYARYWNSLRMLALLASMGMLTASAIIDIKNKKLSVYTLVWLGIVSGTAGVFKGEEKVAMDQLKGFLPKNEWQKYEMNGKADADLLLSIRTEHEKDGEVAEKYKELKKEIGQTTLGKSRSPELKARLSVLQQQYYNLLRDKKGEPTANLLKEKVARASDDADHQPDSLIYLVDRATTTNDIAFGILLDLTKKGIGPESAGKDLAQKEENGDSKGTFHDYDSFSSSSGTNTSDTSSAATPIAAPTNPALSAAPSVATVVQETSPVTKGINETPMQFKNTESASYTSAVSENAKTNNKPRESDDKPRKISQEEYANVISRYVAGFGVTVPNNPTELGVAPRKSGGTTYYSFHNSFDDPFEITNQHYKEMIVKAIPTFDLMNVETMEGALQYIRSARTTPTSADKKSTELARETNREFDEMLKDTPYHFSNYPGVFPAFSCNILNRRFIGEISTVTQAAFKHECVDGDFMWVETDKNLTTIKNINFGHSGSLIPAWLSVVVGRYQNTEINRKNLIDLHQSVLGAIRARYDTDLHKEIEKSHFTYCVPGEHSDRLYPPIKEKNDFELTSREQYSSDDYPIILINLNTDKSKINRIAVYDKPQNDKKAPYRQVTNPQVLADIQKYIDIRPQATVLDQLFWSVNNRLCSPMAIQSIKNSDEYQRITQNLALKKTPFRFSGFHRELNAQIYTGNGPLHVAMENVMGNNPAIRIKMRDDRTIESIDLDSFDRKPTPPWLLPILQATNGEITPEKLNQLYTQVVDAVKNNVKLPIWISAIASSSFEFFGRDELKLDLLRREHSEIKLTAKAKEKMKHGSDFDYLNNMKIEIDSDAGIIKNVDFVFGYNKVLPQQLKDLFSSYVGIQISRTEDLSNLHGKVVEVINTLLA
ncbi:MAG: hypothetical protein WCG83_04135 [Candidatus Peregrinibacteria bacterium]